MAYSVSSSTDGMHLSVSFDALFAYSRYFQAIDAIREKGESVKGGKVSTSKSKGKTASGKSGSKTSAASSKKTPAKTSLSATSKSTKPKASSGLDQQSQQGRVTKPKATSGAAGNRVSSQKASDTAAKPRRPLNAFNFFCKENRAPLVENGLSFTEITVRPVCTPRYDPCDTVRPVCLPAYDPCDTVRPVCLSTYDPCYMVRSVCLPTYAM